MKRYVQTRRIVLISFVLLAFSAMAFLQQASALAVFSPVTSGDNKLFFRDVSNMENSAATVSLDNSQYNPGDTATLTITDVNANADLSSPEFLSVVVSSTSDPAGITIFPQETDLSTGVFVAIFTFTEDLSSENALHVELGDAITVSYEPQPSFAGRFSAQLSGVDVEGFASMSDYVVTEDEEKNNCFVVVTDAVDFQLIDIEFGLPIAASTIVTMSYANAEIGGNEGTPTIFNQAAPEDLWLPVPSLIDLDAKTITTTAPIITGKFVVGFPDLSCSGGGAGGLVRPGLVLNVLAGIGGGSLLNGGSGGPDHSPPSLLSSRSILGSLFAPDPFKPISPGTTAQAPLRINGNGYPLYGYSNTIVTNTIQTGQFTDMSLAFEEASKVEHVAVYFVDQGKDEQSDRDPALIIDNGNIVKVDPDGIFGDDIQLTTSKEGTKSVFNFGMSFDKPTNKNLVIVSWDDKKNSGTTKVLNAIQVVGNAIPAEVGHFMPIEALGEFDLVKDDNGQYVLSEPAQTQTVTPDSPQTIVYPEFIGKMDRHDMKALYDSKDYEKDKANSIMVQKFKLDAKLFADDNDTPTKDLGQAPQLTWSNVGHKLRDLAGTSENKEAVKKMMWQEHLKAEKTLKAYLEQRNHRE